MSLISRNLHNQMMSDDNIELVDIRWLQQWSAYPPTKMMEHEIASLINNILLHGIKDPALLVVNPTTEEIRLDSGNHRVYFLPLLGVTTLPVTCFVTHGPVVLAETNGHHVYKTDCITADKTFESSYYTGPSKAVQLS